MKDIFEDLLKDALIPSEEPDAILTRKILQRAKGEESMRKPSFKTATVTAAIAAVVIATGGLTAYAAWNYLNPGQVAEEVGDRKLAKSFQKEDAIHTNDSQTYGNYTITMLGVVSGKNVSNFVSIEDDGTVNDDGTYAVIAIKKKDGSKMPDTSEDEYSEKPFLATPFIKGEDPLHMNIFYMGGGATNCVVDGVRYQIFQCDNLECFAKRGVYVGVLDEQFYNVDAYHFDKKTGEISRNEEFDGVNALFRLPLDESKADEKAAEEKLAEWKEEANADDEEGTESGESIEKDDLSVEEVQKGYTLMKEGIKTFPASEYGELLTVESSYKDCDASVIFCPKEYFKKGEYGTKVISVHGGDDEKIVFLCERREDGKIVVSPYHN